MFEGKDSQVVNNEIREKYAELGIACNTKAFKRYFESGLLKQVNKDFIHEVNDFWEEHYKKEIDPVLHLAFWNLTGKNDKRIIPGPVMWKEFIPFFNDMDFRDAYSDKNIYDKLIDTSKTVKSIIKRVRGNYFDIENNNVDSATAFAIIIKYNDDLIIKPSNTDNGKGINKLSIENGICKLKGKSVTIEDLEEIYGHNFIVQEKIKQHEVMAAPHPDSVNTLRMVTFRWKKEIRYLLTFARFGAHGAVNDNAGTGGVCCGVTDAGEFMDIAIDEHTNVYTNHPSTNYSFKEKAVIPNFDNFKKFVMNLHKEIIHHDFVSWDIAVGEEGEPVFLELNFRGATWLYQLAAQQPLFGNLTEEVMEYVAKSIKDRTSITKSKVRVLKEKNRALRKKNKQLKETISLLRNSRRRLRKENLEMKNELEIKKHQINKVRKNYDTIKRSRSWRYTATFRKIGRIVKR
ncbi:hypothetical protein HXA35_18395 [Bacillus sp. A301a_S52]|jgi:hypothetical protein|nr:hypothetical protein [Bacillus sp. A301a_S52]